MSAAPKQQVILEGDLLEFDIGDLIAAFGLGRQAMSLEVVGQDGRCEGRVVIKSGRVVSATAGVQTGAAAIEALLAIARPAQFRVLRATPESASRPVGTDTLRGMPAVTLSNARTRVLEGTTADVSLADVLKATALTRQHALVELFDARNARVGYLRVKSGQLLAAQAGGASGVPAVHALLRASANLRFTISREDQPSAQLRTLGALSEILGSQPQLAAAVDSRAQRPSRPPPPPQRDGTLADVDRLSAQRTRRDEDGFYGEDDEGAITPVLSPPAAAARGSIPVLDGSLTQFDLSSLLEVVGTSRQHTSLRVFDDQRNLAGELRLKAGQVVSARAGDAVGIAAVRHLLHSPRDFSFVVERHPGASNAAVSLGTLREVLLHATTGSPPGQLEPLAALANEPRSALASGNAKATGMLPLAREPMRWLAAAGLGAGFVLLGGAAAALILRQAAPASTETTLRAAATPSVESASAPSAASSPTSAAPERAEAAEVSPSPEAASLAGFGIAVFGPTASGELPLGRPAIASMQAALKQLGYNPGSIDGVFGSRTSSAVRLFQYAEQLEPDGTFSAATRTRLATRVGGL